MVYEYGLFHVQEARASQKQEGLVFLLLYFMLWIHFCILWQYVDGLSVKDILLGFGSDGVNEERLDDISITQIGNVVGKLHDGGLVHGDLEL
jgi:tRNA A-37 threonylcarbamoyl transferase component Bud32